jgi:lipopolysaccharide export system protein LptA
LLLPTSGRPAVDEEKAAGQQDKAGSTGAGAGLMDSLSFTSRKEPIHIRSHDLEFLYNDKRITYRGDVVVTQGETTIKSDTLVVTYEEAPTTGDGAKPPKPQNTALEKGAAKPKPQPASQQSQASSSQQQIKEIVAEGNVDITSGDRHATAKKAVFTQASRTVVLTGNAVLQEGENRVTGEKVTVFLDEKRTVVEGGGEKPRVEMIVQKQEGGKKGEKTP